jgi:prepilin-type N-terminal cleavage/methylation domain-containing protein
MVKRRRPAGYTLLELVVAMTILAVFLGMLFVLQSEMRAWEKRLPVNYMKHPQIIAVLARLRRDVVDAHGTTPYRNEHDGYVMSEKTLIVESVHESGGVRTIVWDFSVPGVARRRSYTVGVAEEWVARGLPADFSQTLTLDAVEIPGRPWGVRLLARDGRGRIAIDQILQPRAHE